MAAPATKDGGSDPPSDGSTRSHPRGHGADLGTPSRVSEVLQGKKELSMGMVQRLRARFHIPADLLLPPPKRTPASRPTKRAAA